MVVMAMVLADVGGGLVVGLRGDGRLRLPCWPRRPAARRERCRGHRRDQRKGCPRRPLPSERSLSVHHLLSALCCFPR